MRRDCKDYAQKNKRPDFWVYREIIKDASSDSYFVALEGPYGPIEDPKTKMNVIDEKGTFTKYLAEIENIATENSPIPIWGRPEIEGRMISNKYDVALYFYSVNEENGHKIIVTKIIPGSDDPEVFIEGENLNQLQIDRNKKVVEIVNYKQHFVPLLGSLAADITEAVKVFREEIYGKEASRDTSLMEDIGNFDLEENSDSHINQAKSSASDNSQLQHIKPISSGSASSSQHLSPLRVFNTKQDLSPADSPDLPENFEAGQEVADGNCFFDSFRQGLEQQLGIAVTVEQLRQDCREFAQNNPPEWFINTIANSHDNNGIVRSETQGSYATNILNSNRWTE